MSNLDRALALVAALSAALGVGSVVSLVVTGAAWPVVAGAAFPLFAVVAAVVSTVVLSRRVETQRQAIETLKAHMATLARLVRESNDRATGAGAPVAAAAPAVAPAPVLAVPVPAAPAAEPAADIEALGRIVADIADTVSNHEDRLVDHAMRLDALNAPVSQSAVSAQPTKSVQIANSMLGLRLSEPGTAESVSAQSAPETAAVAPPPARTAPPDPVLSNRIKSALQANRFDLYLRPIVALPQRKTRIYEATIGVEHDGVTFSGGALSALCRRIGIGRQRDVLSLARLIRLARYFHLKGRNAPVFAEISDAGTFADKVFANLIEAMRAEAQVASILMLGVPQAILRTLRPVEAEVLKAFREAGGRLVATDVTDLAMRPEILASLGVRYAQVPASTLSAAIEAGVALSDVHPQDLPGLFRRRGIEMILRDVEAERDLANAGEAEIAFAEGTLFGEWRLVRDDLLEAPPAAPMQDNAPPATEAAPKSAPVPVAQPDAPQRVSFRSLLRRA